MKILKKSVGKETLKKNANKHIIFDPETGEVSDSHISMYYLIDTHMAKLDRLKVGYVPPITSWPEETMFDKLADRVDNFLSKIDTYIHPSKHNL